jgi:hypothetical protein
MYLKGMQIPCQMQSKISSFDASVGVVGEVQVFF